MLYVAKFNMHFRERNRSFIITSSSTGGIVVLKYKWVLLKETHSEGSRAICWLPGHNTVRETHTLVLRLHPVGSRA